MNIDGEISRHAIGGIRAINRNSVSRACGVHIGCEIIEVEDTIPCDAGHICDSAENGAVTDTPTKINDIPFCAADGSVVIGC